MTTPEPTTPADLEAPPVIDDFPEKRNPWGWILLTVIFALLIFAGPSRKNRASDASRRASYAVRLKAALTTKSASKHKFSSLISGYADPNDPLLALEKEAAPRHLTDAVESVVWTAIRTELKEPVAAKDLLAARRDKEYAPFAEIYSAAKLGRGQVRLLVPKLGKADALTEMASNHARQLAGLPVLDPNDQDPARLMGVALLFLGLLFASGFAWLALIGLGLGGTLKSLGPACTVRSKGAADVLALRAAYLIIAFLVLTTTVGLLRIGGLWGQLLAYLPMIGVVFFVLRDAPSMEDVGLTTKTLGRDILLGLWGFLLEIPVTMIVGLVCTLLMRNFPAPEHPATTALEHGASLGTIIVTLVTGALVAPFWEETMFRGLLYPALRKAFAGPVFAALISSFLFASIHPQGPVLWAALASVALFSCVLAQTTRSLVPSVVMHFAHNATLLTLTILISQK